MISYTKMFEFFRKLIDKISWNNLLLEREKWDLEYRKRITFKKILISKHESKLKETVLKAGS